MRDPKFRPPMARVAPRDGPGEFPAPDFNMLRQIDTSRTTPHARAARRGRPKCEVDSRALQTDFKWAAKSLGPKDRPKRKTTT